MASFHPHAQLHCARFLLAGITTVVVLMVVAASAHAAAPNVKITSPENGSVQSNASIPVYFSALGDPVPACTVNGESATSPAYYDFVRGGSVVITVTCTNSDGSDTKSVTVLHPSNNVRITSPDTGLETMDATVDLTVSIGGDPSATCTYLVNFNPVSQGPSDIPLPIGVNFVSVSCKGDNTFASDTIKVTRKGPPGVAVITPADGSETYDSEVPVKLALTGYPLPICTYGMRFYNDVAKVVLNLGSNTIKFDCRNEFGSATKTVTVLRKPAIPPGVTIDTPLDGTVTTDSSIAVSATASGAPAPECRIAGVNGTGPTTVNLIPGVNTISATCKSIYDNAIHTASDEITVTRGVAPAITSGPTSSELSPTTAASTIISWGVTGAPTPTCTVNSAEAASGASHSLAPGLNTFDLSCDNGIGSAATASIAVTRNVATQIFDLASSGGLETTAESTALTWATSGYPDANCTVNGSEATGGDSFALEPGNNKFDLICGNAYGADATASIIVTRNSAAGISGLASSEPPLTSASSTTLTWTTTGFPAPTCTIDGSPAASGDAVALAGGANTFNLACENGVGAPAAASIVVGKRVAAQLIGLSSSAPVSTELAQTTLTWTAPGYPAPTCTVNGDAAESGTSPALALGANTFLVACGNDSSTDSAAITITRNQAPTVAITAPADNEETLQSPVAVTFSASGYPAPTCTVNDDKPIASGDQVDLSPGVNTIAVECSNRYDGVDHTDEQSVRVTYNVPPSVSIGSPVGGSETEEGSIEVSYSLGGFPEPTCSVSGVQFISGSSVDLEPGVNEIGVSCTNGISPEASDSVVVTRNVAPVIADLVSGEASPTEAGQTTLTWTTTGFPAPSCTVNGSPAESGDSIGLDFGANTLTVTCTNTHGGVVRSDGDSLTIFRGDPATLEIDSPANGVSTVAKEITLSYTATGTPEPVCTLAGKEVSSPAAVHLEVGTNVIVLTCANDFGSSTRTVLVTRSVPAATAPPTPVLPRIVAAPKRVKLGHRIRLKVSCAGGCRITPRLKIGGKRVGGVRRVRVKAGATHATIRVPEIVVRQIRWAMRKHPHARVALRLAPRSSAGSGGARWVRLR